jgi:succinate-acetate transporter protein
MPEPDTLKRNDLFIIDSTANPAPMGLCAFGMTTILLSFHNAGMMALASPITAMALFYGGLAQVIVGIMEWKKNNTFGCLTFASFGFFWISFAGLLMLPAMNLAKAPGPMELASFLFIWGVFAAGLFVCSLKMHRALQVTLLLLVVTFMLLVVAQFVTTGGVLALAGVVGIVTGLLALIMGLGQVINDVYGSRIIPV